ncbi:hypothetical protein BB560_000593 [Smittium megazygosporum]|uniref:RRM domain-containing protein n=1 Tax=Smittium megazygosporum TaxID=133381 RepID=A0A2T9ZJW6_9FUNG|nr:hypothetical protein BB560_000593 [Smittium megazygosporum]
MYEYLFLAERAFALLNSSRLEDTSQIIKLSPTKSFEFSPPETTKIVVRHLPPDADNFSLYNFLRTAGPIFSLYYKMSKADAIPEITCSVKYFDSTSESNALDELSFSTYKDNLITLKSTGKRAKSISPEKENTIKKNPSDSNTESPSNRQDDKASKTNVNSTDSIQSIRSSSQLSTTNTQNPDQTPTKVVSRSNSINMANFPKSSTDSNFSKLCVQNLELTVSHSDLFELFKPYGYIYSARVTIDRVSRKSLGFGYVQYASNHEAVAAMNNLKGVEVKGNPIEIFVVESDILDPSGYRNRTKTSPINKGYYPDVFNAPIYPNLTLKNPDYVKNKQALDFKRNSLFSGSDQLNIPEKPLDTVDQSSQLESENKEFDPEFMDLLSLEAKTELLSKEIIRKALANHKLDLFAFIDKHRASRPLLPELTRTVCRILALPQNKLTETLKSDEMLYKKWVEAQSNISIPFEASDLDIASECWIDEFYRNGLEPSYFLLSQPQTPVKKSGILESKNSEPSSRENSVEPKDSPRQEGKSGIKIRGYDSQVENFIEDLKMMSPDECREELFSKLEPLIKYIGYENSKETTDKLLDGTISDIRKLAYAMNDTNDLSSLVDSVLENPDQ